MTKVFLDTNILVYANDHRDRQKQVLAAQALAQCMAEQSGVISTQVLQEFASVALYKLGQDTEVIVRRLAQFEAMEVVQLTPALIRRALEFHSLHQINYWDALIVSAAEAARCTRLWSEDFAPARSTACSAWRTRWRGNRLTRLWQHLNVTAGFGTLDRKSRSLSACSDLGGAVVRADISRKSASPESTDGKRQLRRRADRTLLERHGLFPRASIRYHPCTGKWAAFKPCREYDVPPA